MDRNAPVSIIAAIMVSVVGVFALMIQPMIVPTYENMLGFTTLQATNILTAEIGGTAIASVAALFLINKINWRLAIVVALICVVIGNIFTGLQSDSSAIFWIRLIVGIFGQGTAFAIGISIISNTSDPERNFGFVISSQVAFGVIALATLPIFLNQFENIGGMYLPLAGIAALSLLLVKFIPTGPAQQETVAHDSSGGSLALPITALIVMLIWCCGLGAMWTYIAKIGAAGGMELVSSFRALSVSSAVAIVGSLGAAALAAKGVNRFLPVTIALLVQIGMAWLLQGQMNFVEMAIKASIFQVFWNMTGPFLMGAIAASDTGGRVSVLIPAAQISGFFIGPAIVARYIQSTGLAENMALVSVNYITIIFCAIALVLFIPLSARLKAAGY